MAHVTDWMSLAKPDPEWEAAVEKVGHRPDMGVFPGIPELRQFIIDSRKRRTVTVEPVPGVQEKDHQVTSRDGSSLTARVYTPEGKTGCPLVVIFHGGIFCIGGLENEELLCRRAAGKLGFVAVSVDYRLAPEHKFPTGLYDCQDVTRWAAANAVSIGADPTKGFIVGGSSAGGNFAAVVALLSRDEELSPPITGCHLMIPLLCAASVVPEKYQAEYRSWDQNEHADVLSRKAYNLFTNNYLATEDEIGNPMFSPLLWKTGFKGFPPTYFQICGGDPLRDEGLIFERILREDEKIPTKVEVYPGLPHGYFSIIPTLKVSQKFGEESLSGLKWLSEQKA